MFRTNVEAVQLDLRVLDRNGQFVPDLRRDDFQVFEDGKEQVLTNFALINIPIERPDSAVLGVPRVDPDIASNIQPDGRIYVVVLDDLEGQSGRLRSPMVRAIAREFIQQNVTDVDRVALVTTSGRRDMAQDFTSNRQRVLEAIGKYEGGYGQIFTTPNSTGASFAAPGGTRIDDNLHQTMLSLTALAKWLATIDGRRKSMLLVSERLGRSMSGGIDLALAAGESSDATDFVAAARRGNVSLYVVDPVGVPSGSARGARPIQPDFDDTSAYDNDRIQSLVTLAEATGGFAAVRSNDYSAALARIVVESSSYYLLGYVSSNAERDGKYRKTEVRVRRPDMRVQARSGYVAPRPVPPTLPADSPAALPPALQEVLRNPLAVAGLPLTVAAPAFSGTGSKALVSVIVQTGANQLQFSPSGERFTAEMTLAIAAADQNGKIQAGERGTINMRLSSQTYEAVMDRGARLVSKLELKPGRYQLKIAALDAAQDITRGSVQYDLDVPDFSKGSLAMSGIALASMLEAPMPTTGSDQRWKELLGAFPTTAREFSKQNELREYVEVYDNDNRRPHSLDVVSSIRDASGRTLFRRQATYPSERRNEKTLVRRIVNTIPLNDLSPGQYVLVVEARNSADVDRPVARQVPFKIR